LFAKYFKNTYLRIAVSGLMIIGLTMILGTSAYSGSGANIIEEAIAGHSAPEAFFWKMIFTDLMKINAMSGRCTYC
jgi:hypothetical protein